MLKAGPTATTESKSGDAQHQERHRGRFGYGGDQAPEVEVRAVGLEHDGAGRKETSSAVQELTRPPVRVKVSTNDATPFTGGSVIVPRNVPKIVLPPPKSQSNRPLKILPVATLMQ